jgi:hypothetical protein
VRQRVDAMYAKQAKFDVSSKEGRFQVSMSLPAQQTA